jgi:tetratricopeptide (TPR) repeat protein
MRQKTPTIWILTGLAITLGTAGCYMPVNGKTNTVTKAPSPAIPKAGPRQVVVDSRWAYSATENRPAPEWILNRARQVGAEGDAGLEKLVQRWPDVALELLRQSVAVEGDVPLHLLIAQTYDRVTASAESNAGWSAALAVSGAQREIYGRFHNAREEVLTLFQSGRFADAVKIDPVSTLPADAPAALRTEALRLAGLAALLDNKPDHAAAIFGQALVANAKGPRQQQFEIGLLASEAERRNGQAAAAETTWKSAVVAGARIRDPELWERAILAKPEHEDWPAEAAITGVDEPNFASGVAPDTANVLIGVGKMYLARDARQPALLAFSRAEAETSSAGEKALAGLYRAESMIALHQAASALPMLEGLLACGDPRIARRAQAVQGDVLCQVLGDRQHGIPLMREALEADAADWPGKTQLLANLGLYELLEGRYEEGLARLHEAQAGFETHAQWADLVAALSNEAAFLNHLDKPAEAAAIQKRADEFSRKAVILRASVEGS